MENPPKGCKLEFNRSNPREWKVEIIGPTGSVFAGEKYYLILNFPLDYPAKPPGVYFLKPVPKHVHVYSTGDICLSLLGKDWRPNMTAEALIVSITSMLSSAKGKAIPLDNAAHADSIPGQQQSGWMYHDDKC
jgi:ubiquitin-conjugating enzyme E2 W